MLAFIVTSINFFLQIYSFYTSFTRDIIYIILEFSNTCNFTELAFFDVFDD